MIRHVAPARALSGTVEVPGDKSITHRAVMIAALADHPVRIVNFLPSADCWSTIDCIRKLGIAVYQGEETSLTVAGNGLRGLKEPQAILDAGNSGTTLRLLTGLLGAQPFFSVLIGDESLCHRPMERVIKPLTQMGCRIIGRENSRYAPLAIAPAGTLHGIRHSMPVASAQVKSALLLAGLYAQGPTSVVEPFPSRDHTELLLRSCGVTVAKVQKVVTVEPAAELCVPEQIEIPGDISSAAYWLVAATIIPGSRLTLRNVGVNPTRTGIIDILRRMGAKIAFTRQRFAGQEPVADIMVEAAGLHGVEVEAEIIPRLIDEIPILAVAALWAEGATVVRGAGELKVKESDRLQATAVELGRLGGHVEETADGLTIRGSCRLRPGQCDTHGDHRMAMALSVAAMAGAGADIAPAECVAISYPGFYEQMERWC